MDWSSIADTTSTSTSAGLQLAADDEAALLQPQAAHVQRRPPVWRCNTG
jgi:hypothetical protein